MTKPHTVPGLVSVVLSVSLLFLVAGCVAGPSVNKPQEFKAFELSLRTQHPINVRVVDQRPKEETVPDPKYSSGYAYTTYGAEGQARNFALDMGENIKRGNGTPDYRNLNAGHSADPSGLTFTFILRHWYAKWPLRNPKDPVLVEGEFDVALEVSKGGKSIYRNAYRTEGARQFAALYGTNKDNYSKFVHHNLGQKGNQLLSSIIGIIMADLQKNWPGIVGGEKI